ncbi:hypothetical protein NMY22_g10322 [Coprinellus aureogranulatus]|nr:hypothetical protein NMY22_g10322 [Coprinellus aureogranulatus]
MDLRRELNRVEAKIEEERARLANSVVVDKQRLMKATVGVFAEAEAEVELLLKYGASTALHLSTSPAYVPRVVIAVTGASWSALYDVRANTESKETPVEIVYKAAISQNTGEVRPFTLHSNYLRSTSFRIGPTSRSLSRPQRPPLDLVSPPSTLGPFQPTSPRHQSQTHRRDVPRPWHQSVSSAGASLAEPSRRKLRKATTIWALGCLTTTPRARFHHSPAAPMVAAVAPVTSLGNVNATFRVPGLISIPSDGVAHNVTIVTLKPEAKLSWVTAPSVHTRVHLTTFITNTSEYTLLAGTSSVYVDGSFISKSSVPLVSPQESFTCPLGLDPSIRVTFPPQIKKSSTSGMLTKTSSTSYTQRISVYNSKSTAINNLEILARIPVSQDSQITVKLISPALPSPTSASASKGATSPSSSSIKDFATKVAGAKAQVKVAEGVVAQWYSSSSGGEGGRGGEWGASGEGWEGAWEVSAAKDVVVLGL